MLLTYCILFIVYISRRLYLFFNLNNIFVQLGKTVEQLELTTDTIYEVPTEGVITSKIVGTNNGRIFLATVDGNLYEIDYWVFIF